jgi:DHA3 family macrolide efflux protein-like MFS transporter
MTTGAATPLSFGEVLRISAVKRLFLAQVVSVFGDFIAIFAVIAYVTFTLHGTATQISMILVSFLLPLAFVSPVAGVFVDKWNLKATMITSDVIRGFLILGLVFFHDLYAIYGILFALATVSAFFVPAQSVAVRTVTPPTGLMAVNGLMSQAMQGGQIVAPGIAGALVQAAGANACFIFDAASFFFSASMLMTIPLHREDNSHLHASTVLESMKAGFRFIFTHTAISFVILSMTMGMFAMRCFGALLSVYVRDILLLQSAAFGGLNMLIGVGMIIATQFITRFARHIPKQNMVVYGLSIMGLAVLVTAAFSTVATTAIGMLLLGMGAVAIFITAQTLIQQETPKDLLGRVSSSMMSLMAISQVLAMFLAGPAAEKAGIRNLYFASAAMLMLIAVVGRSKLKAQEAASAGA